MYNMISKYDRTLINVALKLKSYNSGERSRPVKASRRRLGSKTSRSVWSAPKKTAGTAFESRRAHVDYPFVPLSLTRWRGLMKPDRWRGLADESERYDYGLPGKYVGRNSRFARILGRLLGPFKWNELTKDVARIQFTPARPLWEILRSLGAPPAGRGPDQIAGSTGTTDRPRLLPYHATDVRQSTARLGSG